MDETEIQILRLNKKVSNLMAFNEKRVYFITNKNFQI